MKKIDIAMTGVLRPKLLHGTLKTIVDRVVDRQDRFRLIINIDPVGQKVNPHMVVDVCKEHFKNVTYNIAEYPSFPRAVKWVWSQTTAPYIFHWEDDVEILRKIDVVHMMKLLDDHKKLAALRLFTKTTPRGKRMHVFQCHWDYQGDNLWIARDWRAQFGLNPNLIKRAFVHDAFPRMVENFNPEKQFRVSQKYMKPVIEKWRYGIYAGQGETRLVDGRKGQRWKDKLGIDKPKGTTFLEWEKK